MTWSLSRCNGVEPAVVSKRLLPTPFCQISNGMNLTAWTSECVGLGIAVGGGCRLRSTCFKTLPLPLKPHGSIFVEYLIDLPNVAIASVRGSADFSTLAIQTDRNPSDASSLKVGKIAFQKIWSSDQFNPILATSSPNRRVDATIPVKIASDKMMEEMVGNLFEGGKTDSKGFSWPTAQIYQPLTEPLAAYVQGNPICCSHSSTIDHSPGLSVSAIDWSCCFYMALKQAKMSLVFFSKGDREVKTGPITNAAIRIDEPKPIRLHLCVNHIKKLVIDRMLPDNCFNQRPTFDPPLFEVVKNRGRSNPVSFPSLASGGASDVVVTKRLSLILCQCWASHTT